MAQYEYPLDTTGVLASNAITNEQHTITAVNDRNYNFIIPQYAPFHAGSLKVYLKENQSLLPLTEGVDWNPSLQFTGASLALGSPVYGGISFNNLGFNGLIVIDYQTLGGEYTLSQDKMVETLANIIYNPRGVTWEEITGLAKMFPPIDHPWDFNDMVGMSDVQEALNLIEQAIINKTGGDLTSHLQDFLNPHRVTKALVGLGRVEDYGPATIQQGIGGQSNQSLITPLVLKAVLEELGVLDLSDTIKELKKHIIGRDNPHEVDKTQVKLGDVENLPVATASDILSKRRVRKYITLDQMMDYLSLYGCKPTENADIEYAPKNALLSVYCSNLNRMGVYADGNGGTYEKIIEIDSRDCGYLPPQQTQFPARGTVLSNYCTGVDQFSILADGFGGTFQKLSKLNAVECGYTGGSSPSNYPAAGTVLSTRCNGTTLIKTIANGSGGSSEQQEQNSSQCTTPPPANPPADTLLSTYCQGFDLRGRYADGNGGQYTAIVTRNSSECGYTAPTPPPPVVPNPPPYTPPPYTPPPYTPPPPTSVLAITLSTNKTGLAVGQNGSLTANISGMTASKQYTVTFYRTNRSGSFQQYLDSTSFSGSGGSKSLSVNSYNNGDVFSGSYSFKATVQESGGASKDSNTVTIQYTANKTIALTMNGNSSFLNVRVGDTITVRADFRDFPVAGSTAETQPVPWYLEMRGADSRNAGEGQFTFNTNGAGAAVQEFGSTLLANDSIQGDVTYRAVASWKEFGGGIQQTGSNTVTLRWSRVNSPPPYTPPPSGPLTKDVGWGSVNSSTRVNIQRDSDGYVWITTNRSKNQALTNTGGLDTSIETIWLTLSNGAKVPFTTQSTSNGPIYINLSGRSVTPEEFNIITYVGFTTLWSGGG